MYEGSEFIRKLVNPIEDVGHCVAPIVNGFADSKQKMDFGEWLEM